VRNDSGAPVAMVLQGRIAAVDDRHVRGFAGEAMVWAGDVAKSPRTSSSGAWLPAGESTLRFTTDRPGRQVGQGSAPAGLQGLSTWRSSCARGCATLAG